LAIPPASTVCTFHTPKIAKRWHFFMNMTFDGFRSHFRKFIRAAAGSGRDARKRGLASRHAGPTMELDGASY